VSEPLSFDERRPFGSRDCSGPHAHEAARFRVIPQHLFDDYSQRIVARASRIEQSYLFSARFLAGGME
jgi:hypothetical protein